MAWIAAIIAAGATYYESQQKKKAAAKIGSAEDRLYGSQADLMDKLQPFIVSNYQRATQSLDPAIQYYRSIATGDRPQVMSALSPELSSIGNKYRSIMSATRELTPRSGAMGAYNTDLAFRQGDEQQALINQQRTAAYGNLGKLAGESADIAGSAAGHAVGAGQAAGQLFNPQMLAMLGGGDTAGKYADIAKSLFGDNGTFHYDSGKGWYMGSQPGPG